MIPDIKLTREELQRRSEHAGRLLEDELLSEAFANLRIAYFEEWLATEPAQDQAREALYMATRAVQHVENHLRIVLSRQPIEGKMDALKKVQSMRRDTLRRDGPERAGNAAIANSL